MPSRLLQMAAHRTRTVAFVAVAVLAGAAGGAWAVAGAPTPGVFVTTVADETGDPATTEDSAKPDKPEKAEKAEKAEKPAGTGKPDKPDKAAKARNPGSAEGSGVHGACVSAVARSDAVGGKNENHGGAVSEAAHSCPRGGAEEDEPATP